MSYKIEKFDTGDNEIGWLFRIYKDEKPIAIMKPEDFDRLKQAEKLADQTYKSLVKYGRTCGLAAAYKGQEIAELSRKMVLVSAELAAINQILEEIQGLENGIETATDWL